MSNKNEKLSINKLICANGNWYVSYNYNNFGDFILLLLPRFELDDNSLETKINYACENVAQCNFEEEAAIHQFIKDDPDTPFIIIGKSIIECAEKMDKNLGKYNLGDEKFFNDVEIFNKWRNVVYYVSETLNKEMDLQYNGWKSLIDEAEKFIKERRNK